LVVDVTLVIATLTNIIYRELFVDIQREKIAKPLWKKYWYVMLIFLTIVAMYQLNSVLGRASYFVEKIAVVIAKIEQDNFSMKVGATGVLKPLKVHHAR
jgi:hypothetical protein